MTASTRRTVLSLYMRVFRIARTWQAQSGVTGDTETERKYILQEARTLFRQNQQLTDQESIKKCVEECEARIEIGLHYRNPYPRAVSYRLSSLLNSFCVVIVLLIHFIQLFCSLNVPLVLLTTTGTCNSEGQEATNAAAPEEAGQANLLTVT
uniref:LYR motif containing 1 n=1 Tax=Seriola dumerili TaxID=41447 RepID=A0A3B4TED4_SERDU